MIKKHILGVIAILLGAGAFASALYSHKEKGLNTPHEKQVEGGFSIDIKGFSFSWGKSKQEESNIESTSELSTVDPFFIATAGSAVLAILLASFSWVRENEPRLSITAMVLSVLALTWQYVILGVILGVAAIIVCVILYHMDFSW